MQKTKEAQLDTWLGRSPGVGHGNPFQYSCLKKPMDRGAWQATSIHFSSVTQSCPTLCAPFTAREASLSIINSRSLPKPMSIELVMASNHLILCCPLLLLPSIFPSIRVFSSESSHQSSHQVAKVLEFQLQHLSFQ